MRPGRTSGETGSRGPGFAVARELIAAGVRAVAICARNEIILERARRELARDGARVLAMRTDVTDRQQVEAMIETVVARFGRLDVLVNGVGASPSTAVDIRGAADSDETMSAAFWAPLYVTLTARPVMRRRGGGRIINIDFLRSIGGGRGPTGGPREPSGDAGTSALLQFSRALRTELAHDGIVVTTLCPRS